MSQDSDIIRAGKNARVSALAERIIKQLERQGGLVQLEAVGAGAVNQAVKAVAQARRSGYLLTLHQLHNLPGFVRLQFLVIIQPVQYPL